MRTVIVIGGGITGLACAKAIRDRLPRVRVFVFEALEEAGGAIKTVRRANFVCEASAQGFVNRDPSTVALAQSLGLGAQLVQASTAQRGRFVAYQGVLHRFPEGPGDLLRTRLLSPSGRARVCVEPWIKCGAGVGETVGAFFRRRIGREATDALIEPIVAGMYGGDVDALGLQEALPRLADLSRGNKSVLWAALRYGREQRALPGKVGQGRLFSFRGGMGVLVAALRRYLGGALMCDAPVLAVRGSGRRWRVEVGGALPRVMVADAVVAAVPAGAAARFFLPTSRPLSETLRAMESVPLVVLNLGYVRGPFAGRDDGYGFLVSRHEGGRVLGAAWAHRMFPGLRAPKGGALVQAIVGGSRDTAAVGDSAVSLRRDAEATLARFVHPSGVPQVCEIHRHPAGITQYTVGHGQRVARARQHVAALPGLFLAGSSYDGVGVNACTKAALNIATDVVDYICSLTPSSRRALSETGGMLLHTGSP